MLSKPYAQMITATYIQTEQDNKKNSKQATKSKVLLIANLVQSKQKHINGFISRSKPLQI